MTDRSIRNAFTEAERGLSAANDMLSRCEMALDAAKTAHAQAKALVGILQPLAQAEFEAERRALEAERDEADFKRFGNKPPRSMLGTVSRKVRS